jgi:cobalamin synthase
MNDFSEPRLKRGDHWLRLVIALTYFGLLFYLVKVLVGLALAVQFILVAFVGEANHRLLGFTGDLHRFSYHVLQFITWNSNDRPFPFSDWPGPQNQNPTQSEP